MVFFVANFALLIIKRSLHINLAPYHCLTSFMKGRPYVGRELRDEIQRKLTENIDLNDAANFPVVINSVANELKLEVGLLML